MAEKEGTGKTNDCNTIQTQEYQKNNYTEYIKNTWIIFRTIFLIMQL